MKRTAATTAMPVSVLRAARTPLLPRFWRQLHVGLSAQWWNHDQVFDIRIFAQFGESRFQILF
jgi:hypothetical protein